ncbi:Periplasmic nitrate reductase [Streptomyces microflavus]
MTADPQAAADRRTFIPLDPSLAPPGTRAFRDAGSIPADKWHADQNGETLVPTHCCFCGVQCGMYLRVDRGGKVFGVEPRNHDINRMRLCPKGINAYQQVNHPDRLTAPLMRRSRDEEFREASWEEALDFTVSEIQRIQQTYGNDAFGLLGGASLFSEKTYLVGKFARVALKSRHVDYNGRLCMVSAAGATSPQGRGTSERSLIPHDGQNDLHRPGRCIGCQACVSACRECATRTAGKSMIHLDYTDEGHSVASLPTVCMHCEDPVAPCAEVCPADAILVTADGVVQQADTTRCIGCANCVNACPFGVPKIDLGAKLQLKCNLCYDRTAYGLAPMCATVCPTGALFYGTVEELQAERPGVQVADTFVFGETEVRTGVAMVVPAEKVQWPVPGGLPVVEINGKDVRR